MKSLVKIKNNTASMSSFYDAAAGSATPLPPFKEVEFLLSSDALDAAVPQLVQLTLRKTSGEADFVVDVLPAAGV